MEEQLVFNNLSELKLFIFKPNKNVNSKNIKKVFDSAPIKNICANINGYSYIELHGYYICHTKRSYDVTPEKNVTLEFYIINDVKPYSEMLSNIDSRVNRRIDSFNESRNYTVINVFVCGAVGAEV